MATALGEVPASPGSAPDKKSTSMLASKDQLRVIAHIDMDAFYAQIEQVRDPVLRGKPVAVVQYPTTMHNIRDMAPDVHRIVEGSASSIIAVSYEARAFGVKRNMKGSEARKLCPELFLVQVPTRNGKADISLYRQNGEKVVDVLERVGGAATAVEKASIDEVYVDVTRAANAVFGSFGGSAGSTQGEGSEAPTVCTTEMDRPVRWEDIGRGGWAAVVSQAKGTHVASVDDDDVHSADGWWGRALEDFSVEDRVLACGGAVVAKLRAAVRTELQYSCTAGVAHNKLLAKLCSNMHKPNAQTVLPTNKVPALFRTLPVEKVKGWGGKLGVRIVEALGVATAGDVADKGLKVIQQALGGVEGWRAWQKSQGIDLDPVKARSAPKSIGCSKTFPGKSKLTSISQVERWLSELAKELVHRLHENEEGERSVPTKLTVSFCEPQEGLVKKHAWSGKHVSRCCRMVRRAEVSSVVEACLKLVKGYKPEVPIITMLGVSAHGFESIEEKDTRRIDSFFGAKPAGQASTPGWRESSALAADDEAAATQPRLAREDTGAIWQGYAGRGIFSSNSMPSIASPAVETRVRPGAKKRPRGQMSVDSWTTASRNHVHRHEEGGEQVGLSDGESGLAKRDDAVSTIAHGTSFEGRGGSEARQDVSVQGLLETHDEATSDERRHQDDPGRLSPDGEHATASHADSGGAGADRGIAADGAHSKPLLGLDDEEADASAFYDVICAGERSDSGDDIDAEVAGADRGRDVTQQTPVNEAKAPLSADADGSHAFGSGQASLLLGGVDPNVLKELPPDIQKEIRLQQASNLATRSNRMAPSRGRNRDGRSRGGRGARGRALAARRGQATISSFFDKGDGGTQGLEG